MKYILLVCAGLGIGGAEKVGRDIGLYSDSKEYCVHYTVFGDEIGEYETEVIEHGCKVFHLSEPSEGYGKYISDLKKIMSETKYTVVHAHTMFNIGFVMMIAKKMGVPIRVAHAHSSLDQVRSFKVKLYESIMRFLILENATDYVACGEKAGIRLFGEKVFKKSGKLILNGVSVSDYHFDKTNRDSIRNKLHLEDNFLIGHTGHLAPVKNQCFLIKLMPEILKRKPNAKLLLLGDGPDKQMLMDLITEYHLENEVIMTGNVSNVHEYLSAMDVFAFPSLYEGMPLSIIEVQANGLPCVLSTGVPKDVYLTDLIHPVSLDDEDKWINEICSLKRNESEKYANQLLTSGFDTKSVMEKIYSIYER